VFAIQLLERLVYGTSQESFDENVEAIQTQYPAFHRCVRRSSARLSFTLF